MWAAIGSLLLIVIGVWKFFRGKGRAKKDRLDAAGKINKEGMDERDPSKITASNDRINNDV